MRILTVSASPYLLTKLGRINSEIINLLYKKHMVYSAVWHHDLKWFSANESGHYFYEKNNKKIIQILPFMNAPSDIASPQLYDIFQRVKPDLVISAGDYNEVDAIFAIKSLNPKSFKWIHISTLDAGPIKDSYNDVFKYMDYVIHATKQSEQLVSKISPVLNSMSYVGVDNKVFYSKNEDTDNNILKVISCSKNSQTSGIAAILNCSQFLEKDINIYCHTNLYDAGDYDLNLLKSRYDTHDIVRFPEAFVGLNDGVSENELNNLYNNHDIFIDASVRSATGFSLIEAMAAGCVPVVTRVGALKEIVELLPEEYRFFIDSNIYIGSLEEEYQIISVPSLIDNIKKIYNIKKQNKGKLLKMKKVISEVAKKLQRKYFLNKIEEAIENIQKENSLIVESF